MQNLLKTYTEKKNNIFQTEIWNEAKTAQGLKTWWVSCDDGDVLVVKKPLRSQKSYLYVPHGPDTTLEGWHVFLRKVKEIAKAENAVFVRIEPLRVPNGTLKELHFKKVNKFSPLARQCAPENTLLLDITKEENDILGQMKPKTRYNIKLAERKGVKVRQSQKESDLKVFFDLSVNMKERGFSAFPYEHYYQLFKSLGPKKALKLFIAENEKDILSTIIVLEYNEVAIYLHGASSDEKRELMPNHLIQWTAIMDAKSKGCKVYDFWGIAPQDQKDHPWSGITRFKKGFGGEEVKLLGAWDFTIQPFWYKIYFLINLVRKAFRK